MKHKKGCCDDTCCQPSSSKSDCCKPIVKKDVCCDESDCQCSCTPFKEDKKVENKKDQKGKNTHKKS